MNLRWAVVTAGLLVFSGSAAYPGGPPGVRVPSPDSLLSRSARAESGLIYHAEALYEYLGERDTVRFRQRIWHGRNGWKRYVVLMGGDKVHAEVILKGDSVFYRVPGDSGGNRGKTAGKFHGRRLAAMRKLPGRWDILSRNYDLNVAAGDPVAGRRTWCLTIRSKSDGVEMEKAWVDRETWLVLALERWNAGRNVLYRTTFESVDYPREFDPGTFDTGGFRSRPKRGRGVSVVRDEERREEFCRLFRSLEFPPGLSLVGCRLLSRRQWVIVHLSLSDGLRHLSIFARRSGGKKKRKPGYKALGAAGYFGSLRLTKGGSTYFIIGDSTPGELAEIARVLPGDLPFPRPPGRTAMIISVGLLSLALLIGLISFLRWRS